VSAPELTRIPLNGFNILNDEKLAALLSPPAKIKPKKPVQPAKFLCSAGILTPTIGTRVTYSRFGDEPLVITVERSDGLPVGQVQSNEQETVSLLTGLTQVKLIAVDKDSEDKDDCDGKPVPRLPVYGFGDLGSETGPTGQTANQNLGTLIEGTVDVLAHAVQFKDAPDKSSNVYSTNSQVILPPGSRLIQFSEVGEVKYPWVGFAVVGDSAIELHVTSDAKKLAIVRPGKEKQPEILSVGLLTQVANDPLLASVQIVGALLFSAFQFLGMAFSGGYGRRPFDI
jgi:hypothetical protein